MTCEASRISIRGLCHAPLWGLYTQQARPHAAGLPCAIVSARRECAPQDHARWPRGPYSMSLFNGLGKCGNQVA
jgi:hypothetical protein